MLPLFLNLFLLLFFIFIFFVVAPRQWGCGVPPLPGCGYWHDGLVCHHGCRLWYHCLASGDKDGSNNKDCGNNKRDAAWHALHPANQSLSKGGGGQGQRGRGWWASSWEAVVKTPSSPPSLAPLAQSHHPCHH